MTVEILAGVYEGRIDLDDILSHVVGRTLDDQPVSKGRVLLTNIVQSRVGHEMDVKPSEVEIDAIDIMPLPGDESFAWTIEVYWKVFCSQCDYTAIVQDRFDEPVCNVHWQDAVLQEEADNLNDDIAIGLI